MRYDDNIFLRNDTAVSTWGVSATPELLLRKRTPSSAINIGGAASFNRYSESAIRDTDVLLLNTSGYLRSRKSRLRWSGFYKSDTTTRMITAVDDSINEDGLDTSELDGGIVDQNLVGVEIRRNQFRIGPSWTTDLSEISSLRIGYQFNNVNYSGARDVLSDYTTHGVSAGVTRQMSRKTSIATTITGSTYKAPDANSESDTYDITLSMDRVMSPLLQASAGIGARTTSIRSDDTDEDSTGLVADISLSGRYNELTSYAFNIERNVRPSGARTVMVSDLLRADLSYAISPLSTLSARATAFANESLDRTRTSSDRKYYTFEAGIRSRITRQWDMEGTYRYRRLDYDDDDLASDSNSVSITAIYSWPRISVSR